MTNIHSQSRSESSADEIVKSFTEPSSSVAMFFFQVERTTIDIDNMRFSG